MKIKTYAVLLSMMLLIAILLGCGAQGESAQTADGEELDYNPSDNMISVDDLEEGESQDLEKYEDNTQTVTEIIGGQQSGSTDDSDNDTSTSDEGSGWEVADSGDEKNDEQNDEMTVTLSIRIDTIFDNIDALDPALLYLLEESPLSEGVIYQKRAVIFYEGESVFDVLQRETRDNGIHMEFSSTPAYGSAYVEGINSIYETSVGPLSGWRYSVNGLYPNYGCSKYQLEDGDDIEWNYTCDLGRDLPGGEGLEGGQQ